MAFNKTFKPEEREVGPSKYTMNQLQPEGSIKFRVLSEIMSGKSVWGEKDGKRTVTRVKDTEAMPVSAIGINKFTGEPERVKQFVAAVVWNYETKQLEILETDKATVISALWNLEQDEDFGDIRGYDVKVSRKGEGTDTKYLVNALSKGDPDKDILKAYDDSNINLEALYEGTDPFGDDLPFD